LLAVAVLTAAGCGGGNKQSAPNRHPYSSVPKQLAPKLCSSLSAQDVTRVSGITPVNQRGLARLRGSPRLCGTVYFDAAGSLLVQITEDVGGAAALRRLRSTAELQFSRSDVRSVSGLGGGAFLARRRILTFAHNSRVVTLQTGYQADGRLSLTIVELTQLGRLVAGRA
jgi:hypothetical protein